MTTRPPEAGGWSSKSRDPPIQVSQRRYDLSPPHGVGRGLGLARHLGAGQRQRLQLTLPYRVDLRPPPELRSFLLALGEPLLEPIFRVDVST